MLSPGHKVVQRFHSCRLHRLFSSHLYIACMTRCPVTPPLQLVDYTPLRSLATLSAPSAEQEPTQFLYWQGTPTYCATRDFSSKHLLSTSSLFWTYSDHSRAASLTCSGLSKVCWPEPAPSSALDVAFGCCDMCNPVAFSTTLISFFS